MPKIRRYVGVPSVLGALGLVFAMVLASPAAQAKPKPKPPKPEKISGDLIVDHGGGYPGGEQTVSAKVKGNLIVRAGADDTDTWAFLDQVTVDGDLIVEDGGVAVVVDGVVVTNVFVNPGGAFGGDAATTTTIKGGVEAFDCSGFRLSNAEVSGDVLVSGCVGLLEVGGAPQDQVVDILNSTIKGSVTYTGNHGSILLVGGGPDYPNDIKGDLWFTDNVARSNVEPFGLGLIFVYDNTIGGSADISGNSAGNIYIINNSITQDLVCADNDPPPLNVETNTVGGTTMCVDQTP
jgi:hypothetical protein